MKGISFEIGICVGWISMEVDIFLLSKRNFVWLQFFFFFRKAIDYFGFS